MGQDYGIAVRRGQPLLVTGLGSEAFSTMTLLDLAPAAPEGVAWSDDGSVAVLYSRSGSWIQIATGVPGFVHFDQPLSLLSLGGSLSSVAAHGRLLAIGITGEHSGVYDVINGNFVPLLDISRPVALAFSEDGTTLYALEGDAKQVIEVHFGAGHANFSVASWRLPMDDAVALRPAHDPSNRQILYVAGRNDRALMAFDSSSHESIAQIPLSFEPTAVEPLGKNEFILRSRPTASDPLWTLANAPQPAVYFVPGAPAANPIERRRGVPEQ
jgi:hypothetical protein